MEQKDYYDEQLEFPTSKENWIQVTPNTKKNPKVDVSCYSLRSGNSFVMPVLNLHPAATREADGLCRNQRYSRELLMMGIMVPKHVEPNISTIR